MPRVPPVTTATLPLMSNRSSVMGGSRSLSRGSTEEHPGDVVHVVAHQLELVSGGRQRDPDDLAAAEGHHLAEVTVVHGVDRGDAEAGAEHPVERCRCAAALHVTEHHGTALVARALLD